MKRLPGRSSLEIRESICTKKNFCILVFDSKRCSIKYKVYFGSIAIFYICSLVIDDSFGVKVHHANNCFLVLIDFIGVILH